MIRRIVGWAVLLPLSLALIVFALANRHLVPVNFNPFATDHELVTTSGVPLYLVIFGVLLVGVLLGGIATWFAEGTHRREERHYRRETERLHRELEQARRAPTGRGVLEAEELAGSR